VRRALAALAAAALVLGGCSSGGGSKSSDTGASGATGPVEPTHVRVITGLGKAGAFDPEAIYKSYAPGVVTVISILSTSGPGGGQGAQGSGFVIDKSGYVATNAHVVRGDPPKFPPVKQVYVQFSDGNRVNAQVVGADLSSDVALLKVNPSGLNLTPVPLGSSSRLEVGQPVAAIGSPFGEQQSLSIGVISAVNRDIDSLTQFKIGNAIQTDAAINHGNSGGPLLDARGRVIGINSQIQSTGGGGEGVGFAVPIDTVKRSLGQLRAHGSVQYAYLGVQSQDLYPQLAQRLGFGASQGALVAKIQGGSPASKSGLSAGNGKITFQGAKGIPSGGDAITAVDGRPVRHADDLANAIGLKAPNQTVTLTVYRGKTRRTVKVKLAPRPATPAPSSSG
jgi:S1-C subfamily serine protease